MLLLFQVFVLTEFFYKKTVTLNDVHSLISHLHATFCDYNSFSFRDCGSKTAMSKFFCTILLFFVMIAPLWNAPLSHFVIKIVSIPTLLCKSTYAVL